jgi:hypothetical protein
MPINTLTFWYCRPLTAIYRVVKIKGNCIKLPMKMYISNSIWTTRFWNKIHDVPPKTKNWKVKWMIKCDRNPNVSYSQCCLCLWINHSCLPLRFSFTPVYNMLSIIQNWQTMDREHFSLLFECNMDPTTAQLDSCDWEG